MGNVVTFNKPKKTVEKPPFTLSAEDLAYRLRVLSLMLEMEAQILDTKIGTPDVVFKRVQTFANAQLDLLDTPSVPRLHPDEIVKSVTEQLMWSIVNGEYWACL